MKYTLLTKNYDTFSHPKTQLPIRLHRIVAMKDFETHDGRIVRNGEVGGYIESEANLSQTDHSWVFHQARVFDSALLIDSIVCDNASVFGHAQVADSTICNSANVSGNSIVTNSVIADRAIVSEKCEVRESELKNSTRAQGNSKLRECKLFDGSMIGSHATAVKCTLRGTASIAGTAKCTNCEYSGRVVILHGEHNGETLDKIAHLTVESNEP